MSPSPSPSDCMGEPVLYCSFSRPDSPASTCSDSPESFCSDSPESFCAESAELDQINPNGGFVQLYDVSKQPVAFLLDMSDECPDVASPATSSRASAQLVDQFPSNEVYNRYMSSSAGHSSGSNCFLIMALLCVLLIVVGAGLSTVL